MVDLATLTLSQYKEVGSAQVPRTCLLGKFPNLVQYTRMPRWVHIQLRYVDIISTAGALVVITV